MNADDQNSLDDTLNPYFKQRKQQHKMPAAVAQTIHDHAQQATLDHVQQTNNKKFLLLRPPIWATTFAACFVIVISIYFMPLEANFETDAAYFPAEPRAAIPESIVKNDAPVMAEFSPGIKTEQKRRLKKMPTRNVEAAYQTAAAVPEATLTLQKEARKKVAKPLLYPAPKQPETLQLETHSSPAGDTSYRAQLASVSKAKQQAGKKKQDRFNYTDADMNDEVETIAVAGARISQKINTADNTQKKAAKKTVVQIQAREGKPYEQQLKTIDCDGQIKLIDIKHLENIKHNDWVRLYFDDSGQLIHVEKLKQKPKTCNDRTNIK
ncbi:MAG: hypothetical protein MJK04_28920 [Psychrosphaera sp.]|nr:hypothetical protein [Psychrosphaera sp.]